MVTDDDDVTVLQSDNGKSASISADQELKQELSNESPQNGELQSLLCIAIICQRLVILTIHFYCVSFIFWQLIQLN